MACNLFLGQAGLSVTARWQVKEKSDMEEFEDHGKYDLRKKPLKYSQ
jgi:hypothetical protein